MNWYKTAQSGSDDHMWLYNASLREYDPQGYLEPVISGWVEEVASGAGDVPIEEITYPLSYMSDEATGWITMIVGRKVNKHPDKVSLSDVYEHGRLNVISADKDETSVYRVGDYSETQEVQNLRGERVKFWETDLYDEGDIYTGEGRLTEMPVGPEPSDFITADSLELSTSLIGGDLILFIKMRDPELYGTLLRNDNELV